MPRKSQKETVQAAIKNFAAQAITLAQSTLKDLVQIDQQLKVTSAKIDQLRVKFLEVLRQFEQSAPNDERVEMINGMYRQIVRFERIIAKQTEIKLVLCQKMNDYLASNDQEATEEVEHQHKCKKESIKSQSFESLLLNQ